MRIPFRRLQHPLAELVTSLLITFLILFPKGGLKLGGAPITWGYLLLAITALPLLFYRLLVLPLRATPLSLAALASMLPFQFIVYWSYKANGYATLDYLLSLVTNFFALPFLFLFVYSAFFPLLDRQRFIRSFCNCVFWAAAFGIFLFIWRPVTGHLIEVPGLTVNLADAGQIELTKHIARGAFLKLISTYNNGNVYGVATLILLPLFTALESRRSRRITVRVALLLTLSRTVWAGLIVEQLLSLVRPVLESAGTFPRVNLHRAAKPLLFIVGTAVAILVALFAVSYDLNFLFDPTLGGRAGEFSLATTAKLLPAVPLNGFSEILFASALTNYGYVGLFAILLLFCFPIILMVLRPETIASPVRSAAGKGLVLYVVISLSDGATNLIPVMAFYWFIYSIMLCGLPGHSQPAELSPALASHPPDASPALADAPWTTHPSQA